MRTKLQLCDSADLCHQCNGNFGQILLEIKLIRQKAVQICISRRPEVFLGKGVLKICSKFTGEHPCQSAVPRKLLCNFIKIALLYGCSHINLLRIFRTNYFIHVVCLQGTVAVSFSEIQYFILAPKQNLFQTIDKNNICIVENLCLLESSHNFNTQFQRIFPVCIYLFKLSDENTRTMCKFC